MHPSIAVLFAVFAISAGASLGLGGKVLIEAEQGNIVIANENGQQVSIAVNQQGALKEVNGPQTIVVEISGPGRIPKLVEVPDQQVEPSGISQSDILQLIFNQASGVQSGVTFQAILDAVAAKVAKGKISPSVLAALETVSPLNQQDNTAANQILKQTEQKQLEKQAVQDALTQQIGGIGLGGGKVVVEAGIDDILVANGVGQQVNIAIKQQSRLGGPQVIQIQVSGPGVIPRSLRILDQQVGLSQGDILQQIVRQNRGVQNVQTYQVLLDEVAAGVAKGLVSPAILAVLEAVAPQNQGNPATTNLLLDQAQQIASSQGGLQVGLQSQVLGLSQIGSRQGQILVEEALNEIVIANQQGQQVRIIASEQGGLYTPEIIVIQVIGLSGLSKSIQIPNQQIAPGVSEIDVLRQIVRQYSGLQAGQSYQAIINTVAAKVAVGELNPVILAALEAVSPQNQLPQILHQSVIAQQIQLPQQIQLQQSQLGGLWGSGIGLQGGLGLTPLQRGASLNALQGTLGLSKSYSSQGLRTPGIVGQAGLQLGLGRQNSNYLAGLQGRTLNQVPLAALNL